MLLKSDAPPVDNLKLVMGELARAFRWNRRPRPCDPESKRNNFQAMCCRCDWSRDLTDSRKASDAAMVHGEMMHGDPFAGFVCVQAR